MIAASVVGPWIVPRLIVAGCCFWNSVPIARLGRSSFISIVGKQVNNVLCCMGNTVSPIKLHLFVITKKNFIFMMMVIEEVFT